MAPTMKTKPTRCFHPYSSEIRATLRACTNLGHRQRERVGEFFYTHPAVPGIVFRTASAAMRAAMERPFAMPEAA